MQTSRTADRKLWVSARVIALAWRAGFSLFANFPIFAAGLLSIIPSTAAFRTIRSAQMISRRVFLENFDTGRPSTS